MNTSIPTLLASCIVLAAASAFGASDMPGESPAEDATHLPATVNADAAPDANVSAIFNAQAAPDTQGHEADAKEEAVAKDGAKEDAMVPEPAAEPADKHGAGNE